MGFEHVVSNADKGVGWVIRVESDASKSKCEVTYMLARTKVYISYASKDKNISTRMSASYQ